MTSKFQVHDVKNQSIRNTLYHTDLLSHMPKPLTICLENKNNVSELIEYSFSYDSQLLDPTSQCYITL